MQGPRGEGDPLGMISRRRGDHPPAPLRRRQKGETISRTPNFKRSGLLEVLQL